MIVTDVQDLHKRGKVLKYPISYVSEVRSVIYNLHGSLSFAKRGLFLEVVLYYESNPIEETILGVRRASSCLFRENHVLAQYL